MKIGWLTWAPYDQMPTCELMRLEKVLLLPKEPPPDPVSEICGKERRLGDSDFGVRGDQILFRLANIRPALED